MSRGVSGLPEEEVEAAAQLDVSFATLYSSLLSALARADPPPDGRSLAEPPSPLPFVGLPLPQHPPAVNSVSSQLQL